MTSIPLNRGRVEMAKDQLLHSMNQIKERGRQTTKEDWGHVFEDVMVTVVGLTRDEYRAAAQELLATIEAMPDGFISWQLVPKPASYLLQKNRASRRATLRMRRA